jgi:hypothetical protein
MEPSSQLIASTFLFRFALPCRPLREWPPSFDADLQLPDACRLPALSTLDGHPQFGQLALAWHAEGLALSLRISGKSQTPWCRESSPELSDGLSLFIDTRPSGDIHRASRFCHHFVFMPLSGSARQTRPLARLVSIARAKEEPKPIGAKAIPISAKLSRDGYCLSGTIPAELLTGYDVEESRKLGFFYIVRDRELGWQSLGVDDSYPVMSDPSLWGSLELDRH